MFDEDFLLMTTEAETETWVAFKIVTKFLGKNEDPDYVTIVANKLKNYFLN
jgi:hypothetical protein